MGIKFTSAFKIKDIVAGINKKIQTMEDILIDRLQQVGEQFVADARSEPSRWKYIEVKTGNKKNNSNNSKAKKYYRNGKVYTRQTGEGESFSDWTGNLRSSIGYVIYKDGEPIDEKFPGEYETGRNKGKEVAESVEVPKKGFVLVVVAGMDYALAVEAKNYDVITGSSYAAEKNLKQAIEFVRKNM